MSEERILLKDIPKTLLEEVVHTAKNFSIGFYALVGNLPLVERADLIGSGTLVLAGGKKAILTAQHVIRELQKHSNLGLLLEERGASSGPYLLDKHGVTFFDIDRGSDDAEGPDLGAVVLAPTIGAALGAKKSFYNLDLRRDHMLDSPLELDFGIWLAQGFLQERTFETKEDDGTNVKTFYNYGGFGSPDKSIEIGKHDYFAFPVSEAGRREAPVKWGGMSGGGLWQIPLKRQGDGVVMQSPPLLSGVVFYQEPTTETTCGVKCHGRRSVYEVAYAAIAG